MHLHEVALIFHMESVLGTAWVWFVIKEVRHLIQLLGVVLLLSVSIFILKTAREKN